MIAAKAVDAAEYPHSHTELPFGADVVVSFEGRVLRASETSITLSTDAETWVTVEWSYPVDNSENVDPVVVVCDYGFKPGDVAVSYADNPHVPVTFLAMAGPGGEGVKWLDQRGFATSPDPSTLTLVMRDGSPVPPTDTNYEG